MYGLTVKSTENGIGKIGLTFTKTVCLLDLAINTLISITISTTTTSTTTITTTTTNINNPRIDDKE